ncbi:unnamed protein product [Spirodela intermedia]|uniref:Uncharacterized protein n=1 Tax=Spirodela intermedia TaxID=51605 RepID=A0A7I8IWS1_SPIIN|nr:unnamed protein product [Spirodela intermedia]CAA6662034.1 unnamed protein product [Spirodela intermedia]
MLLCSKRVFFIFCVFFFYIFS